MFRFKSTHLCLVKKKKNSSLDAQCPKIGIIKTELHRNDSPGFAFVVSLLHAVVGLDAWQGAQNTIHLATSNEPTVLGVSGAYFSWFAPMLTSVHYRTASGDEPSVALSSDAADAEFMRRSAASVGLPHLATCDELRAAQQ